MKLIQLHNGVMRIIPDNDIPDFKIVRRGWLDRLFSLTPWRSTKQVKSTSIHIMNDGTIKVSPKTRELLEEALLSDRVPANYV